MNDSLYWFTIVKYFENLLFTWIGSQQIAKASTTTTTIRVTRRLPFLKLSNIKTTK